MEEAFLYRKIAEKIRLEILSGGLKPGDRLPSVRQMASDWDCTVGTVQHAYGELARQGLVTSRAGQGTRVVDQLPSGLVAEKPLRKAALVNRAEAFLLEVLTSGYSIGEVENAVRQALDRWREAEAEPTVVQEGVLRFAGSHDMAITWMAGHLAEIAPGYSLQLHFNGSLGGLMALAEGEADLAGCHLWDAETDSFNLPFVRRIFPGRRMALVTLAQRRIGLILPAGNPDGVRGLEDLSRPGLRFVNRQPGSGTRVWLDARLRQMGIDQVSIQGYQESKVTHSAVARAVAEGLAQAGIGLEAAALSMGLDFVFLMHDRYDLVLPGEAMREEAVKALVGWLNEAKTRQVLQTLGGYDAHETGQVVWVE
jgi:molybdate-binding protein/DNA-binding transcriptional regulator YhcF (GntR family)